MVASARASGSMDQVGPLEENHDLPQILFGNFLSSGDVFNLHGLRRFIVLGEVSQREDPVIALGTDFHLDFIFIFSRVTRSSVLVAASKIFIGNFFKRW